MRDEERRIGGDDEGHHGGVGPERALPPSKPGEVVVAENDDLPAGKIIAGQLPAAEDVPPTAEFPGAHDGVAWRDGLTPAVPECPVHRADSRERTLRVPADPLVVEVEVRPDPEPSPVELHRVRAVELNRCHRRRCSRARSPDGPGDNTPPGWPRGTSPTAGTPRGRLVPACNAVLYRPRDAHGERLHQRRELRQVDRLPRHHAGRARRAARPPGTRPPRQRGRRPDLDHLGRAVIENRWAARPARPQTPDTVTPRTARLPRGRTLDRLAAVLGAAEVVGVATALGARRRGTPRVGQLVRSCTPGRVVSH